MRKTIALTAVLTALMLASAIAGPVDIPQGARCYECGMKVDPGSPYAAEIVAGGELLPFCDIGDMLVRYHKMENKPEGVYVRDQESGRWIDARQASFVRDAAGIKTPMGWGIAAFETAEAAAEKGAAMTFEDALKAVR
ncbi:MAG: hypothetical protein Kow0025_11190 [Thermodesulfovibrionales bacterium]